MGGALVQAVRQGVFVDQSHKVDVGAVGQQEEDAAEQEFIIDVS